MVAALSDRRISRATVIDRRYRRESFSSLGIIFHQTVCHAVSVFTENTLPLYPIDVARSVVIARLDAIETFAAVHNVRFAVNNRATVEPCRQQIARVNVAGRSNLRSGQRGGILV